MLRILDDNDFCSLLILIAILALLGDKMVKGKPRLSAWGYRIAALALFVYCGYAAYTIRPVRAIAWVWILVRALMAATLALGLAWCVLSLLSFAASCANSILRRHVPALFRTGTQPRSEECDPRSQEGQRQARLPSDEERRSRERDDAEAKAQADRRRANARASVELNFTRLAENLGDTFTRDMLKEYLDTYMRDDHAPEDVEQRGKDLIASLETQIDQRDHRDNMSISDLQTWRDGMWGEIESSAADDGFKQRLLAALNVRYAELAAKLIEETEP